MASRRDEQTFLLVAILIGIYSGLAVVTFRLAIDWIRLTLFGAALEPAHGRVLIVPAIGGLVVAALVVLLFAAAASTRRRPPSISTTATSRCAPSSASS